MNSHYLNKLEYNKVLNLLEKNSTTYLGKNLCLNLKPVFKLTKVKKILSETSEMVNLTIQKNNLPICEIPNIEIYLKQLESSYAINSTGLLNIAFILKLSRELKNYFYSDKDFTFSNYPILSEYFENLYINPNIENKIFLSILDENTIADDASSSLQQIRRKKRKIESEIKEHLNNIIHSTRYSKYIMEAIVTIRNDRYVIPVKEEFKGQIKGFIHDFSSSGSTLFIEPMSIFELNNQLNNLKIEENIEIEKILYSLSSQLFPLYSNIQNNLNLIGLLDFINAKAKYSNSIKGICPIINNEKTISLIQARHPLINNDTVVPIDVEIGKDYTSLIITGPNTGGKTVTLKTIGLLTIMACSGLHIPAKENSSIHVFDNIFADIGDEQSIQESLSTFSAHMLNTIYILNNISDNSLVLLDELGSGTDPIEGASLATAILEYLYNTGAITVATTHYQEIKEFALKTPGFENASSEFDIDNLKPTYKLLLGVPGKSNAFSICKKLGLNNSILQRAKEFTNKDSINIEDLLKNIYDNKLKIEKEKDEIEKNLNQITLLRKSLEESNSSKIISEKSNIEKAKREAKNIIISAKEDVNETIKDLEKIICKWKELDELDLNNLSNDEIANYVRNIKQYSIKKANIYRKNLNNSLNSLSDSKNPSINTLDNNKNSNNNSNNKLSKEDLTVGMQVNLNTFSDLATIISLSGKKDQIQIQIGNIKTYANINDIINIEKNNMDKKISISTNTSSNNISKKVSIQKSKNIKTEINVIGQTIDEACFVIDKYLDDCYLAKLQNIRIVHGKGTGKLREGIHQFLKKHPHVKSYRLGTFGEGEMGVTIVELK